MGENLDANIVAQCIGRFIAADAKPEGGDAAARLDYLVLCNISRYCIIYCKKLKGIAHEKNILLFPASTDI